MAKLISNSLGVSNFENMKLDCGNVVVVVNAFNPTISVLRLEDDENTKEVVTAYISGLNVGCNYKYKIVGVVGNTYFCN